MGVMIRRGMSLVMVLLAVLGGVAGAQEVGTGITVTGTGSVFGRPGIVEINAVVFGDGELASDASVRYRDARRRAVEAIEGLKIPSLSIESKGVTVVRPPVPAVQQRVVQGVVVSDDPPVQKVAVVEQLRLVLQDADKLETSRLLETLLRVVDAARDSGLEVGPAGSGTSLAMQIPAQVGIGSAMITYRIADASGLRDQAYKLAVEDARSKATRLAELSGVRLGRVVSIRELEPSVSAQDRQVFSGLQSSMLGEIPIQVRLSVQFEIVK